MSLNPSSISFGTNHNLLESAVQGLTCCLFLAFLLFFLPSSPAIESLKRSLRLAAEQQSGPLLYQLKDPGFNSRPNRQICSSVLTHWRELGLLFISHAESALLSIAKYRIVFEFKLILSTDVNPLFTSESQFAALKRLSRSKSLIEHRACLKKDSKVFSWSKATISCRFLCHCYQEYVHSWNHLESLPGTGVLTALDRNCVSHSSFSTFST